MSTSLVALNKIDIAVIDETRNKLNSTKEIKDLVMSHGPIKYTKHAKREWLYSCLRF